MRETYNMEYKAKRTNTYLKTVSAFANFSGGEIIFGVTDSGEVIGVDQPEELCLTIENQLNDNIEPRPNFRLFIHPSNHTVHLMIESGENKPYTYKNKAYKRSDAVTIEVDREELRRLVLQGLNKRFEQLPASRQDLSFSRLEKALAQSLRVKKLSPDILRTLQLYSDKEGYNIAAELLSDDNSFPGIDCAEFGEYRTIILDHQIFSGCSILEQLELASDYIAKKYSYEKVVGLTRQVFERIPIAAIRESLANALVHRDWDIRANVQVSLLPDRVEITSPSSLPIGVQPEDYLHRQLSVMKNEIIGLVFFRLGLIESLGTGVYRIQKAYQESITKPDFIFSATSIQVILPVMMTPDTLVKEEYAIYSLLEISGDSNRQDIQQHLGLSKPTTIRTLNSMIEKKAIQRIGSGRKTIYRSL